jgi:orotate phosphoribosyltransferase
VLTQEEEGWVAGRALSNANDVPSIRDLLDVPGFLVIPEDDRGIEVKQGYTNPFYVCMKALWQRADLLARVSQSLLDLNSDRAWGVVIGVNAGGVPHAAYIADRLRIPFALLRDQPRRGDWYAGSVLPDASAERLVVEDVIATGRSAELALKHLGETSTHVRLTSVISYGLDSLIAKRYSVSVTSLIRIESVLAALAPEVRQRLTVGVARYREFLRARIDAG